MKLRILVLILLAWAVSFVHGKDHDAQSRPVEVSLELHLEMTDDEKDERNKPTENGGDGEVGSPPGEISLFSEFEIKDWFLLMAVICVGLLFMSRLKIGYGHRK